MALSWRAEPEFGRELVRELQLSRRRSRMPWVFVVYHRARRPLRARAEDAVGSVRVDAVTARAVAPIERLARWALPLLVPGGALVAIRGQGAAEEVAEARPGLARLGAGEISIESYGAGVVDPETRVVRLESRR